MDVLLKAVAARRLPEPNERRRIREQVGLTQDEIANQLGVSRATVARWEAGTRRPRRQHVTAYAGLLRQLSRVAKR